MVVGGGERALRPDLTLKPQCLLVIVCCQIQYVYKLQVIINQEEISFSSAFYVSRGKRQLLCVPADSRLRHITLHIPEIQFRVRPRLQQWSLSQLFAYSSVQSAVVKTEYNARPASFSQLICLHGIVRSDVVGDVLGRFASMVHTGHRSAVFSVDFRRINAI